MKLLSDTMSTLADQLCTIKLPNQTYMRCRQGSQRGGGGDGSGLMGEADGWSAVPQVNPSQKISFPEVYSISNEETISL